MTKDEIVSELRDTAKDYGHFSAGCQDFFNEAATLIEQQAKEVEIVKTGAKVNETGLLAQITELQTENAELRKALEHIATYPIHSEPVGGAMDMQDIAAKALLAEVKQ